MDVFKNALAFRTAVQVNLRLGLSLCPLQSIITTHVIHVCNIIRSV